MPYIDNIRSWGLQLFTVSSAPLGEDYVPRKPAPSQKSEPTCRAVQNAHVHWCSHVIFGGQKRKIKENSKLLLFNNLSSIYLPGSVYSFFLLLANTHLYLSKNKKNQLEQPQQIKKMAFCRRIFHLENS